MKNLLLILPVLVFLSILSSCSIIDGIFKTGMGIGAFVVIIIVIFGVVVSRRIKKK